MSFRVLTKLIIVERGPRDGAGGELLGLAGEARLGGRQRRLQARRRGPLSQARSHQVC